ncbi:MAG: SH3 domain-containing protein [Myxococcota bacterium]
MRALPPFLGGILATALTTNALAAVLCLDETGYPAVHVVRVERSGVRVFSFASNEGCFPLDNPVTAWRWNGEQGWSAPSDGRANVCDSRRSAPRCDEMVPELELDAALARRLRPHLRYGQDLDVRPASCARVGASIFFGVGFYEGEGADGLGAIGRYRRGARVPELRFPEVVRNASVAPVAHDGEWLWMGTYANYECMGPTPRQGLLRYRWDTDEIEHVDAPCGFVIHDLAWDGERLWVAHELGVAVWTKACNGWQSFAPAAGRMEEVQCLDLYRRMLDSLSSERAPAAEGSPRSQLVVNLRRFRPELLESLGLQPQPPPVPVGDPREHRLTVVSGGRVRAAPSTSAGELMKLPLGTRVVCRLPQERSDWCHTEYVWVRRNLQRVDGWVSLDLTTSGVTQDRMHPLALTLGARRLADANISAVDAADLVNFLSDALFEDGEPDDVARLELMRLLALQLACDRGADEKTLRRAYGDVMSRRACAVEPGVLWRLHEDWRRMPSADDIAFHAALAVTRGPCDGSLDCEVNRLSLGWAEYLRLHPDGAHSDDVKQRISRALEGMADALAVGVAQADQAFVAALQSLRENISHVAALVEQIDGLLLAAHMEPDEHAQ